MIDPSIFVFLLIFVIGIILIGLFIANSFTPKINKSIDILYQEHCSIIYSLFGIIRMGGMSLGYFSITETILTIKLITRTQYNISDILDVRLKSGLSPTHVSIKFKGHISSINIYSKNSKQVIDLLSRVRAGLLPVS